MKSKSKKRPASKSKNNELRAEEPPTNKIKPIPQGNNSLNNLEKGISPRLAAENNIEAAQEKPLTIINPDFFSRPKKNIITRQPRPVIPFRPITSNRLPSQSQSPYTPNGRGSRKGWHSYQKYRNSITPTGTKSNYLNFDNNNNNNKFKFGGKKKRRTLKKSKRRGRKTRRRQKK